MTSQQRPLVAVPSAAELRTAVANRPLAPIESLSSLERWSPTRANEAREIVGGSWASRDFGPDTLRPPMRWRELCADNRSHEFKLYSWDHLGPVLAAHSHTGDGDYLAYAAAVAVDWAAQHDGLDSDAPFAWYDMAIGLRAYRLGYIIDAAARSDAVDDGELEALLATLDLHLQSLANDENFAAHSNHGFYFAAGQLALARRLPMVEGADHQLHQAESRTSTLLERHFSAEGVHKEHSPDYHRMVLETFSGLIDAGLLEEHRWGPHRGRMREALAWCVLPNGHLATFGDSPHRLMRRRPDTTASDALAFVTSAGSEGKPPVDTMRLFKEGGYVVFRDGWPSGEEDFGDWSYLAQTAAFHSRTHKQADDLSFVWFDHGHELLIDPGRFGYLDPVAADTELGKQGFYYGHPSRVYVESTTAHNTVEIDGRSYQRRGVKPYGSALVRAGEYGGVYYSEAHVRQFKTIRHRRVLLFRPREWLLVLDWLHDNADEGHRFAQRFHFAPELDVRTEGGGFTADLPDGRPKLHVVGLLDADPLDAVRGQTDPSLLGWLSREDNRLDPCWTAGYAAGPATAHTFATLFAFGTPPEGRTSKATSSGRTYELAWTQDSLEHTVQVKCPEDEPFSLDYQVGFRSGR